MGQGGGYFADQFKQEGVALLARGGWPLLRIAGELGISPLRLRNWRNRRERRHAGPAPYPIAALARLMSWTRRRKSPGFAA
jgi:transposase-like protein